MKGIMLRAAGLGFPALLLISISATTATAETANPVLTDRFTFRLGGLFSEADANVAAVREPLPKTRVSLDDLGIDETQSVVWLSARWRFTERWSATFSYNEYDESGANVVDESFNFDGEVYPVGARIDTRLKADAYVLDFTYAFLKGQSYELGAGIGVHAFDFAASIKGEAFLDDNVVTLDTKSEELLAPVPNLRVFGTFALGPRTSVGVNAGWLSASYEDYDGRFLYVMGLLEYRVTEHFGAGFGYQFTDVKVEHDPGDGDYEEYKAEFDGWIVYLSYGF